MKTDSFILADNFIKKQERMKHGYSKVRCFRMFGVSSSGYYAWKKRLELEKQNKIINKDNEIKDHLIAIIKTLGFVPGKRTFRLHLWRDYDMSISVKKVRKLMREMNLIAYKPKKDAYKGQATYFHPCSQKQNHVDREFKIGFRQVVLTDITYLYYGPTRRPVYLCSFKDAYTNEIVGYAIKTKMDVELVKEAYNKMMEKHGQELRNARCFLHSDQGSQYLSCEFKQILEDDNFIQSVSRRGNSIDNSPMESFFARMKNELLDVVARCTQLQTVKDLIDGYMNVYNNQRYQYGLAGLAPSEYAEYQRTGIYPLDNYFGVKENDLMSIEQLVEIKIQKYQKELEKNRKGKAIDEASLRCEAILKKDYKKIEKEIIKWEISEDVAKQQILKLNELLDQVKKAIVFYDHCDDEVKEALKNPNNWRNYEELSYVDNLGAIY